MRIDTGKIHSREKVELSWVNYFFSQNILKGTYLLTYAINLLFNASLIYNNISQEKYVCLSVHLSMALASEGQSDINFFKFSSITFIWYISSERFCTIGVWISETKSSYCCCSHTMLGIKMCLFYQFLRLRSFRRLLDIGFVVVVVGLFLKKS